MSLSHPFFDTVTFICDNVMLIEVGSPLISQRMRGFEIQWSWPLIIVCKHTLTPSAKLYI
jgi:hypothetical protein